MPTNEVKIRTFTSGSTPFFYSSKDNEFATAVLEQADHFNPIILYGPSGVGKSHIARAFLLDYAMKNSKSFRITTADDIINSIISSGAQPDFVYNAYANDDILLIDDAFVLNGKSNTQLYVLDLITRLVNEKKSVVLITDELERLDKRFIDALRCFDAGMVAAMSYPVEEVRRSYAEYSASELACSPDPEQLKFIAANTQIISQVKGKLLAFQVKGHF